MIRNRTSRSKPTHILLLKTLLKISYAFSTAPYYDFQTKKIRKFKLYSIYSSCTFLLIIVGFFYSSIFISDDGAKGSSQSQQIGSLLEMLASLLLVIATLTAVSGALFKSDKWYYLLEQLQNVDVKLGFFENDSEKIAKEIYLKLLLIYLPKVCKDVYCIYAYSFTNVPRYLICNTIFEYYCFAPTLLLVSLALILKDEYKAVMGFLMNSQRNEIGPGNNFVITELFTHYITPGSSLRSMSKMFRLLNSILDNYNHIFGYQLLFMLGHTLLSVLQTFDYCLKYREATSNDSTDVLFANLCITGFNLVKCSIVIISCDITTREAGKLIDICYNLEEKFPSTSVERKEVLKLVRLARYKSPCFSAAGFFNVDRKTLFGFLNVTTTYFIIIIQFNQS